MTQEKVELKNNIQRLIDLNAEYYSAVQQLNDIKSQKNTLENTINSQLKELNLENKTFILNHNKIQQKSVTQYQALSLKYINECLENYIEENELNKIIEIIKSNRSKKIKQEIKIT